jgi:hypothetical protein
MNQKRSHNRAIIVSTPQPKTLSRDSINNMYVFLQNKAKVFSDVTRWSHVAEFRGHHLEGQSANAFRPRPTPATLADFTLELKVLPSAPYVRRRPKSKNMCEENEIPRLSLCFHQYLSY